MTWSSSTRCRFEQETLKTKVVVKEAASGGTQPKLCSYGDARFFGFIYSFMQFFRIKLHILASVVLLAIDLLDQ